jgi:UDPglucose 6-dehydrogenase
MVRRAVGVVGVGTVGTAVVAAFDGLLPVHTLDPRRQDSVSMDLLVQQCEVVFLCVPTPMGTEGEADLSAYEEVIHSFVQAGGARRAGPVLCVRSAVPPDAIARTIAEHPGLRLVVSPEFLRQRSPIEDMLSMRSLVLGGLPEDCATVERLFRERSRVTGPMRTAPGLDAVGAAFLKYQENCFLAMKVSFMNEMFDLFAATESAASWEALQTAFHLDHERVGTTHWHVPGPDGERGWGGHCLPKDVSATRHFGRSHDIATPMLDAIWARNELDRPR